MRATTVEGWERSGSSATWLLGGLAIAASLRALLNGDAAPQAFAVGSAFGAGLLAMAIASGWRPGRPRAMPLLIGAAGGAVLVVLPRLIHPLMPAVIGVRPQPFAAWVLVTALVAVGEEAVLRGAIFTLLERSSGVVVAVAVTSAAFALMHVPLYGWQVVPLDLGVGIWLAGLRIWSGSASAPAVAHLLADLSTWWL